MTAPLIFSPHHRHLRIPSTPPLTPASTTLQHIHTRCIYTAWSRRAHEGSTTASMSVYAPPKHTRNQWVSSLYHTVYIHRFAAISCGETYARGVGKNIRARCIYTESSHHPPRSQCPRRTRPMPYRQAAENSSHETKQASPDLRHRQENPPNRPSSAIPSSRLAIALLPLLIIGNTRGISGCDKEVAPYLNETILSFV